MSDKTAESIARQCSGSSKKPGLKHLFFFSTWRCSLLLALGVVASILAGALRASFPILLGKVFSVLSGYREGSPEADNTVTEISESCVALLVLGGVGWAVNFVSVFAMSMVGEIQAQNSRRRVFQALLEAELEWFDRQHHGTSSLLIRSQM
jgi:ATP-binding cassette, subfamily B (MDR/TAP), member 1